MLLPARACQVVFFFATILNLFTRVCLISFHAWTLGPIISKFYTNY